jgi:integrase
LQALPIESKEYFFWSGEGKSELNTHQLMRRTLALFGADDANSRSPPSISGHLCGRGSCSWHSNRTLQLLLGQKSINTTEKHYAPFVPAMQKALDEATESLNFQLGPALAVNAH